MKKKRYLVLAVFCVLGIISGISASRPAEAITYAIGVILFIWLYFRSGQTHSRHDEAPSSEPANSSAQPEPVEVTHQPEQVREAINPPASDRPVISRVSSAPIKKERFRVAGVSFRQDSIADLGVENEYYHYTKQQIIDEMMDDEKIYEYEFFPQKTELIPEPDNPHDPNAIKVVIDNVLVGYIKTGSTAHVKNLLASSKISSIDAEISGGRYKIVSYDSYDDKYTTESGKTDFHITVEVLLKNE